MVDSLEYKEWSVSLSRGLKDVSKQLQLAVRGDLADADIVWAIEQGRLKLEEYEALLAKIDDEVQREQVTDRFARGMDKLRSRIAALEK